jgi:choice-of-anchor A domain-containing protein
MSSALNTLAVNSTQGNTVVAANHNLTFQVSHSTNGIAYFNIQASTLENDLFDPSGQNPISNWVFSTSVTSVINVIGNFTNLDNGSTDGVNFPATVPQDVLFNFENATSLTLYSWETSVLAPDAETSLIGNAFDGFIYTKDIISDQNGINNYLFTGDLPRVPEPGTLALLAVGLAATLATRRARRAT